MKLSGHFSIIAALLYTHCLHSQEQPQTPNWQISVDVLYWKAHEDRLQYTNQPVLNGPTSDFTETPLVNPHFEWSVGFREKFAYAPMNGNWSLFAQWTQIKNTAHGSKSVGILEGMFPVWVLAPDAFVSDFVTGAEESWKLMTNIFDAAYAYHYTPIWWVTLSPYGGLRGAILNQTIKIEYSGGIFAGTDYISMRNDFWGVGPIVGFSPEFHIDKHKRWNVFGLVAASMLMGQVNEKQKETYFDVVRFDNTARPFKLGWVMDYMAGLKWRIPFAKQKWAFDLQAGWEYHEFYSQNRLPQSQFHLLSDNRNLKYRGWFFTIGFEF